MGPDSGYCLIILPLFWLFPHPGASPTCGANVHSQVAGNEIWGISYRHRHSSFFSIIQQTWHQWRGDRTSISSTMGENHPQNVLEGEGPQSFQTWKNKSPLANNMQWHPLNPSQKSLLPQEERTSHNEGPFLSSYQSLKMQPPVEHTWRRRIKIVSQKTSALYIPQNSHNFGSYLESQSMVHLFMDSCFFLYWQPARGCNSVKHDDGW